MLFLLVDFLFFYEYATICLGMYAVPIMAVFCSSLMSFPDMFRYFLSASEMAPVAPIVTGHHFGFCIPHTL